jgi:hypothetical protein
MSRSISIAAFLLWSVAAAALAAPPAAPPVLEKRKVLKDAVELMVPKDFVAMSADEIRLTYAADKRPNIAFRNADATVTIAVTHAVTRVAVQQLQTVRNNAIAGLRAAHPQAVWLKAGNQAVAGLPGFVIDLKTGPGKRESRLMLVGTSLYGRLFTLTLTAPVADEARWAPVLEQIASSVKFA